MLAKFLVKLNGSEVWNEVIHSPRGCDSLIYLKNSKFILYIAKIELQVYFDLLSETKTNSSQ